MKVTEHYDRATEPLISFEIIPPRRGASIQNVFDALDRVKKFNPPFIDITSHAAEAEYIDLGNGTMKRRVKRKRPGTIGLCAAIKHRYNVDPVPHLICKGFTKEETEDALIELHYLGIDNVLAVRGDDHGAPKPHHKDRAVNTYASDLVRQVKDMNKGIYLEDLMEASHTDFCVGVGGYPEKHNEAPNLVWDIKRLKDKVAAGADYIVTQMFFDNQVFFEFVDKCRAEGITIPIIPGLKVLTRANHLVTLPKAFHLSIPCDLSDAVAADPESTSSIGQEWARKQCLELLDHGVPGLHFYIMSDPSPAINVIESLPLGQSNVV
ncbi:MAG: 5,10-methylenetetrahydrofolate reductase MetF [Bacteroidetes bacterium HLUCCA01]|nr:MAG: 5,10-methylenetetrahydrofolate reductase MetF [Bacteroidetes bacterium HLUCCA01]